MTFIARRIGETRIEDTARHSGRDDEHVVTNVASARSRPLRMASFPNPNANPYIKLFYDHLTAHGIERVPSEGFNRAWIRANRGKVDLLHFHWPSLEYAPAGGPPRIAALARFIAKLWQARLSGYKIVWTLHNLYPHERGGALVDWLCRMGVVHSVDLILITFPDAANDLRAQFGRRRGVHVIPHGNYAPVYPHIPTQREARRALGLEDDAYIYLLFGQIRPYKGADIAIDALRRLDAPDARLYVVGQQREHDHARDLEEAARRDARAHILISRDSVPDEQAALWLAAANCVVAPYREIYTSGVLYLAATFGKPLIAPRLGIFRSMTDLPFVSLYEPDTGADGLARAMASIRRKDPATLHAATSKFNEQHDWRKIAARLADILDKQVWRT